ncbi:hypothetical protein [Haloarcula litorea]|uniref:hypothetical protein n=1 Tax=Haloarcula litorea TaxID=3032579 RepID=UPI0023E7759C|nr:hypothetical protein [Halomicroarcula sp. GDY20]
MYRRALLAALPATLAGCGLAPSGPTTESYPSSPPNVLLGYDWRDGGSTCEVRFERGNRVTTENTGALLVGSVDADGRTVWVGGEGDAAAEFPLSPGDSLTHALGLGTGVRVVWQAPSGDRSVLLGRSERPTPATGADG